MDPLTLVRQFTIDRTPVNYVDGFYIFGKHKFHESTRTAFRRTHKSGGYYTLRDVIFFLENANLQISEYRAKVNTAGVTAVVVLDSPNLMNYLTGQIDTCDQIDLNVMNSGPIEQIPGIVARESQLSEETMRTERMKFVQYLDKFLRQTNSSITTIDPTPTFTLNPDFIKVDQSQLATARADELPATNRAMVLIKPGSDFGFALQSFHDHVLKDLVTPTPPPQKPSSASTSDPSQASHNDKNPSTPPAPSSHKRPHESQSQSHSHSHSHSKSSDSHHSHSNKVMKSSHVSNIPPPNDGMNGVAIIIVPSAVTSILCSLNCIDFLRDGKYVSVDEKRRLGTRREPEMRFEHFTKSGRKILLRVLDTGTKLTDREWARVVAVFVQGQDWQFKGWKWSTPVDLFQHVLGFHLMLDDREVDPKILSWNCRVLKINSSKRHLDASAFNEFWIHIEDYIRISKPWILGSAAGPSPGSGSGGGHHQHHGHHRESRQR